MVPVLVLVGVGEYNTLLMLVVQANGCLKVTISGLMSTMMDDDETGSTATVMEAHVVVVVILKVLLMMYGLEDKSLDSLSLCHPHVCNPVVTARQRASVSSARD